MNIVVGKPVRRVEVGDALPQFALLPLQLLGFGFLRGRAETVRQRGRGRIPLGCYHTGPPVGFFIESIVMAPRRAVLAAAFAVLQEIISETAALLRGNPGVRPAGSPSEQR